MRKNIVLMSVLATILSSCGASNSGPTGDGKKIANHKYTALESILVETTINTKTVPDGTSIKISKSDAIKENIINKGLVIMEGGTLDGTLTNSPEKDNENQYFSLNSGTIKGAVTNEMGRFRIRGGKIKGDFTSNGGATYIYGDKEARIDGEFKSTGKSTLNAHNNNTIRITTGPKHLSVKKAIFDENTKFSFVLTDDIQSSDKIPTHTLISSDQDIIFGSKTVFNFEKNNQKPIPKGKKVTVFKSPNFTLANPEITYDNTSSSVDALETGSISLTEETNGDSKYLVLETLEEIAAGTKPKRVLNSKHRKGAHCFARRSHHGHDHVKLMQNNGAFDSNAQTTDMSGGLSLVSSTKDHAASNFVGFNQKIGNHSFGMYAQYGDSLKDAGVYNTSSFGKFNVLNHVGFNSNNKQDNKEQSMTATSQISLPCNLGAVTFAPKVSLGYVRDIDFGYSFTYNDEKLNALMTTPGAFEVTFGADLNANFSIKGISIETFASLDYTSNLSAREMSVGDENYSITPSQTALNFGINAALDTNAKLYGTYKVSSQSGEEKLSHALELGMNFKF